MSQPENRAQVVQKAIATIEKRLESDELAPTVADLVRLLQIEKEFDDERPVEVRVKWVESSEIESASKA